MRRTDRQTSPYLYAALGVATLFLGLWLAPSLGLAKPAVPEVPGEVVRMDASPLARERRLMREVLETDRVALVALRQQLAAAADDDARGELQVAIEGLKNATRVRLLDVQIEQAGERGERAVLVRLSARRLKLVRQVGEPKVAAAPTTSEVAR